MSSDEKENATNEEDVSYAVFVPNSPARVVLKNIKEVHDFLRSPENKTRKDIRFKRCADKAELDEWFSKQSRNDEDSPLRTLNNISPSLSPRNENTTSPVTSTAGEPSTPYPSVSGIELTAFKKTIIAKDAQAEFDKKLAENPRYIWNTSSDNPTLIQAGCRYNAMHIACQYKNLHAVKTIIKCVTSSEWIANAYGTTSGSEKTAEHFLSAFLNTPEKGASNTPLHFACKANSLEIARELLRHKACNRNAVNNFGQTPLDMCLQRNDENMAKFESLFRSQHYVALYRIADHSRPAMLAITDVHNLQSRRFAESEFKSRLTLTPSTSAKYASPVRLLKAPEEKTAAVENPGGTHMKTSPRRDLYEYVLSAYAGPFDSYSSAEEFYQTWLANYRSMGSTNLHKGYEMVGRRLARTLEVPGFALRFYEMWSFLSGAGEEPIDITSVEGLRLLNAHLQKTYTSVCTTQTEDNVIEDDEITKLCNAVGRLKFTDTDDEEEADDEEDDDVFLDAQPESERERARKKLGATLKKKEEDEIDEDKFYTAPQTPKEVSRVLPLPLYLTGSQPMRDDDDLLGVFEEITPEVADVNGLYYVSAYLQQMRRVSLEARMNWPAKDSPRATRFASSSSSLEGY